ncbi:MAG: glycosyltransferase [Candidatus Yanofskybacteria bacterium]|nr:glycosyltransferase [Candidatus Yanofskybacteria bacterium]
MRILYFGSYDPNYTRNRVLIDGLRQNGVEVIECRDSSPGIRKFINLFKKHRQLKDPYDIMVVGFLGQQIVPFAKIISRKPIIFDAFLSLYDSNVFDRKTVKRGSMRAFYYWILDWLSMHLADVVLFDTDEHIKYASKEFGVKKSKFRRIWIGASDNIFYPMPKPNSSRFLVVFHGSFIPLQGIEYILKAAKICEKDGVNFLIIGDGQEKKKMLRLSDELGLKNVEFAGFMSQEWIREKIARADVCLGIFGDTQKTLRVIPNKVYECLAMQKPVITADTPATRELFNEEDMMLVKVVDSESLANAILRLKNDPDLRDRLATAGYNKFKNNASPRVLGNKLKNIINEFK